MIISIVDFVVSHNLDQLAWLIILPDHFNPNENLQSYDNIIRYKISWSEMRSELIMILSYGAFLSFNFKKYFFLTLIRFPTAISTTIIQLVAINNASRKGSKKIKVIKRYLGSMRILYLNDFPLFQFFRSYLDSLSFS